MHKFRKGLIGSHTEKYMYMIRHSINSKHFMISILNNAGDVSI
ncbi:hypothetical protein A33Q_0826 [Indibacter alkaliphilus LW1]|uniref:Uncharacterized protein n=1 Tax=Indibacter alkaliphilus (strain CCUG 57479 / KCTC 22604 / LW1) TaxID=1189612 RepID=S2E3G3_INDAL|nr:hypothetical protein A33Q_0826 [Indibacter alkaliphilus LW1]